ncbi:hypothetical protein KAI87_00370, partial [Myxococcota bacterium]|nr:hypothetical protein [Myxococcota bacterium]
MKDIEIHPRIAESATDDSGRYYVLPLPLPPSPALTLSDKARELSQQLEEKAEQLNQEMQQSPLSAALASLALRAEAVLLAQIEGEESSVSALLQHEFAGIEAPPQSLAFLRALNLARQETEQGYLSIRLLGSVHQIAQGKEVDSALTPELREVDFQLPGFLQGESSLFSPPADEVLLALGELELFWADEETQEWQDLVLLSAWWRLIHPFEELNDSVLRIFLRTFLNKEKMVHIPLFLPPQREMGPDYAALWKNGDLETLTEKVLPSWLEALEKSHKTVIEANKLRRKLQTNAESVFENPDEQHSAADILFNRPISSLSHGSVITGIDEDKLAQFLESCKEAGILSLTEDPKPGWRFDALLKLFE